MDQTIISSSSHGWTVWKVKWRWHNIISLQAYFSNDSITKWFTGSKYMHEKRILKIHFVWQTELNGAFFTVLLIIRYWASEYEQILLIKQWKT